MTGFGQRLEAAFDAHGRLCVGVDPHPFLLDTWSLPRDAAGAREFGLRVVAAAAGVAGIVKPQVAFFERYGSAGYLALERVLAEARDAGLLVIADAKRGDVGSTVEAYGQAWLADGPLSSDAMTVSAFQGVGSIAAVLRLALQRGRGVFVLAATSNPESFPLQRARLHDDERHRTVSRVIIDEVSAFNRSNPTDESPETGSIGVVLGATVDLELAGVDTSRAPEPVLPVLAPGFGHQGARLEDARDRFGGLGAGLIVTESRSLLGAGRDGIRDAIVSRAHQVQDALG